ncbi:MAG: phage minor capsid protein [Ruminococcus sp.]|nr:phage minor capsid protein [Ruminococcus sp.]
MLTPNYLWYVADRIVEIYNELNTFAIKDICRRLVSTDWQMTETARYQLNKLMQSGVILQDIQEKATEITGKSEREIARLFKASAIMSMKYSDVLYSKAGYNVLPFTSSENMMNILMATYLQTNGTMANFTQTIARACHTEFYNQIDKVYMQIISGQSDYISAIRRAIDEVSKQGIKITYPSGAEISVEGGVRRAVVTGVNQACCKLEMERLNEFNVDLVVTSQHYGARPSHAVWQGRIFSLSSNSPYPNFYSETGYGTGDGLGGWNCRHSFSPFFEGLNKVPQQYDISKNNEIYKKQQEQRRLERNIRTSKRKIESIQASIDSTNDANLRASLQQDLQKSKVKLEKQYKSYNQYCKDTGLRTQSDRLQIGNKSYSNLTSAQNDGILKSSNHDKSQIQWLPKGEKLSNAQFKELRDYAKANDITIQGIKKSDVDMELIKEVIDEASNLLNTYPILKGTERKPFTISIESTMANNDFGSTTLNITHIINLNENAFRNKQKLIDEYQRLVDEGWFAKGTSYKSIIVHEIGHLISDIYNIDSISIAKQVLNINSTSEVLLRVKKDLSIYASSFDDGSEIISEVFSAYYTGKRNAFIDGFMKEVDRIIKGGNIMNANTEVMYWCTNEEWYSINKEKDCFELTDKAPERAIKSFELYKERNHYKERFGF